MTEQTLEKILANRLKNLAKEMDYCATELRELGTEEAKTHAKELNGASKITRQWAREFVRPNNGLGVAVPPAPTFGDKA